MTEHFPVFISWSGTTALSIAEALKLFFDDVVQVKAFVSSVDIPRGDYWNDNLQRRLQDARFGILVLTPANLYEPWILFEAGALARKQKRCCPLLFGVAQSRLTGHPLSALNHCEFTKDQMSQLIGEMANEFRTELDGVRRRFDQQWPVLAKRIEDAHSKPSLARILLASEQPRVPPTLMRLRDAWERLNPAPGDDFKLFSFCGISDDSEHTSVSPHDYLEQVYYLWADAEHRSSISAVVATNPERRLVVRFNNGPGAHACNVAIRPNGRHLLRSKTPFKKLSFMARIPADRAETDAPRVQLGIRIMDAFYTQWMNCEQQYYDWRSLSVNDGSTNDGWKTFTLDLSQPQPNRWRVFTADRNHLYAGAQPDFTAILAVVIEMGRMQDEMPAPTPAGGSGVIELKTFEVQ